MFITDLQTGPIDEDSKVANILRKSKKPIVLVVNKVDNMRELPLEIYDFYALGIGDPVPVSASQGLGTGDLLDEVVKHFGKRGEYEAESDDDTIKVAIIGKPNVGKSSLINRILGEERLIVSNIPGTTRDSVDTEYVREGQKYIFIDTAGMRRKSKVKEDLEKYSLVRTVAAIEKADVCVLLIDATDGVTDQDTKIAGIAHERGKAMIIVTNKWDLIEKDNKTMNKFLKDIENEFAYMAYSEKMFISVLTGQRVSNLFNTIIMVNENRNLRIKTGMLNEVLTEALAMNAPPQDKGRALRIYYATQVSVRPPTFILFVNDTELMHFSYRRYLENQFRLAFGFKGTPIHFIVRNRKD